MTDYPDSQAARKAEERSQDLSDEDGSQQEEPPTT